MENQKLLFIVNPHAGNNRIRLKVLQILDNFVKSGYDVTFYSTQKKGDATEIIEKRGAEFDTVICCGGDGTLNESLNGVIKLNSPIKIGYIPCGTTNDFAFNYKLPTNNIKASERICSGIPTPIDVGILNGRAFSYVAAFGAFTDIPYQTPQQSKAVFGKFAYYTEVVKSIPKLSSAHASICCNGETFEDDFLYGMISNSLHIGGFKMSSIMKNITDISLNDGKLEAMFVSKPKNPAEFQEILNTLLFSHSSPLVRTFQTDNLSIRFSEPTSWTLDGEFGGDPTEVSFSVHSGISLIV